MSATYPRYNKEEYGRRGDEVYAQKIRALVERDHIGEIVALDIESGEFEVAKESLLAASRLKSRMPDAQIWCVRVGDRAVDRIGSGSAPVQS